MVILLRENSNQNQINNLVAWLESMGIIVSVANSGEQKSLGLIGNVNGETIRLIESLDIVHSVKVIKEPYKSANRTFHPEDTVITVGDAKIGGGNFMMIAGPCSVESEEQVIDVARKVKSAGANVLRGGAFKPRTSPYSFQGMGEEGIRLLLKAKAETGLPIVTEIMDAEQLPLFKDIDIIQVGARNMQNFELLKKLGALRKPILLKRGLSATMEELLMSAEYVLAGGNTDVILCERGIRTFETLTRNTLDILAVPVLQKISHLPVIVDPSHSTGKTELVPSMSLASAAAGADGLIIEVHNDPKNALCDGPQSLTPDEFRDLKNKVDGVLSVCGKNRF